MRLRAPSYPLITIDPYFSVWSPADCPTDTDTTHWTGKPITLSIVANVDGNDYRLIGKCDADTIPAPNMIAVDCNAFSTIYTYSINGAKITLKFTSPIAIETDCQASSVKYILLPEIFNCLLP